MEKGGVSRNNARDQCVARIWRRLPRIMHCTKVFARCRSGGKYLGHDDNAYAVRCANRSVRSQEQARFRKLRVEIIALKLDPIGGNAIIVDAEHIWGYAHRLTGFVPF
jgi:hypothetical protein